MEVCSFDVEGKEVALTHTSAKISNALNFPNFGSALETS